MNTDRRMSGRSSSSRVGPGEAELALLHEHGPLGQVERDVDRLLDDDDRGAPPVDLVDDLEQPGDDGGREPERQLVDHQQLGSGHQRAAEGQHLLLATRQVAGQLAGPLGQDGEQLEHLGLGLLRPAAGRRG